MAGHRRAEATPSFRTAMPGHDDVEPSVSASTSFKCDSPALAGEGRRKKESAGSIQQKLITHSFAQQKTAGSFPTRPPLNSSNSRDQTPYLLARDLRANATRLSRGKTDIH